MTLRVLVCMLLLAPARAQGLLDLVVSHARSQGAALLIPRDVAADLASVRPDPDCASAPRAQLDVWLASRQAGLSRLPTGGMVVYRWGSDWARRLLERDAPLIEREELARRSSDLVWTLVAAERQVPVAETGDVVEVILGVRRVLGGPADAILARIGASTERPPAAGLIEEEGPPRLDGPPVASWLERLLGTVPGSVTVVAGEHTSRMLDELRIWSDVESLDALRSVGVRVVSVHITSQVFGVEAWPPIRTHGVSIFAESAIELEGVGPTERVTLLLKLEHLDPRRVANALSVLAHGPVAAAGGTGPQLVLWGRAHSVRLWAGILRLADVPD